MKKKLSLTSKHLLLLVLGAYDCQKNLLQAARELIVKIERQNNDLVGLAQVYVGFLGLLYDVLDADEKRKFCHWHRSIYGDNMTSFIFCASAFLYAKFYDKRDNFGETNKKFLPLAKKLC